MKGVPTVPLTLVVDIEPLVEQVLARLRPIFDGQAHTDETRTPKRAFRTPEAAQLLSLSDSEVRLLISQGELESIRVGRVRLVPASAIDRFLQRKLAEPRGTSDGTTAAG